MGAAPFVYERTRRAFLCSPRSSMRRAAMRTPCRVAGGLWHPHRGSPPAAPAQDSMKKVTEVLWRLWIHGKWLEICGVRVYGKYYGNIIFVIFLWLSWRGRGEDGGKEAVPAMLGGPERRFAARRTGGGRATADSRVRDAMQGYVRGMRGGRGAFRGRLVRLERGARQAEYGRKARGDGRGVGVCVRGWPAGRWSVSLSGAA